MLEAPPLLIQLQPPEVSEQGRQSRLPSAAGKLVHAQPDDFAPRQAGTALANLMR